MLSYTPVRSDDSWHEPHCDQVYEIDRIGSIPEQGIKNFIVAVYYGYDLTFERARCPGLAVMMSGLAVLTTELLIGPAVTDLAAALKAHRHFSCMFLVLHHANLEYPFY